MSDSTQLALPLAGGRGVPPTAARGRNLSRRLVSFGRSRRPTALALLVEALVEARGMAQDAHRRFPFADY